MNIVIDPSGLTISTLHIASSKICRSSRARVTPRSYVSSDSSSVSSPDSSRSVSLLSSDCFSSNSSSKIPQEQSRLPLTVRPARRSRTSYHQFLRSEIDDLFVERGIQYGIDSHSERNAAIDSLSQRENSSSCDWSSLNDDDEQIAQTKIGDRSGLISASVTRSQNSPNFGRNDPEFVSEITRHESVDLETNLCRGDVSTAIDSSLTTVDYREILESHVPISFVLS